MKNQVTNLPILQVECFKFLSECKMYARLNFKDRISYLTVFIGEITFYTTVIYFDQVIFTLSTSLEFGPTIISKSPASVSVPIAYLNLAKQA